MPSYIALVNYTEQGIRSIQDSPKRSEAFLEAARAAGVTVKALYWTSGEYDGVLIVEAPDDPSAQALFLDLGRSGNVRTRTLRAYDRTEMEAILAKL